MAIDFGNALNSGLTGGMTGASFGSAVPGVGTAIGAGAGALLGVGGSLFQQMRQQSLLDQARATIENMPKFENSDAYRNAASQAGRADRWAQEGFTQEQLNAANQGIDRLGSNALATANTLESGLQGMSGTTASLRDAYTNLATQDAQIQQARQAQALNANKNFQTAQEDAFGFEAGRQLNLLDITLGEMGQSRSDAKAGQKNIMTAMQSLLDSGAVDGGNQLSTFEQRQKAGMPYVETVTAGNTTPMSTSSSMLSEPFTNTGNLFAPMTMEQRQQSAMGGLVNFKPFSF